MLVTLDVFWAERVNLQEKYDDPWLKRGHSAWLLVPAAASLALFAWLLSLHETAAGRVYAAYGGVYIGVALLWLWGVDGVRPTTWDVAGVAVAMAGMGLIMFQPR